MVTVSKVEEIFIESDALDYSGLTQQECGLCRLTGDWSLITSRALAALGYRLLKSETLALGQLCKVIRIEAPKEPQ